MSDHSLRFLPSTDSGEYNRRSTVSKPLLKSKSLPAAPGPEDFKALAESMLNLAWMANPDGWIFWYNPRWYEYTGKTPQEMEGWGWKSVHDPSELPRVLENWQACIATGQPFDMEFPLRNSRGEFRWFLTRIQPYKDRNGRILRWFGTNTDIHDLKLAQTALRESERRLRLNEERFAFTQQAAKIASWEYNFDEESFVWTPEVFELFGQDPANFQPTLRAVLQLMYYSTDRDNFRKSIVKSLTNRRKELGTHFRIRRGDGDMRIITARGKAFFNQGAGLLLGVFVDVTEVQEAFPKNVESR